MSWGPAEEVYIAEPGNNSVRSASLDELCNSSHFTSSCTIIFLNTTRTSDATRNALNEAFNNKFTLPGWFWSSMSQKANGFHFGERTTSASGESVYLTVFRLLIKAPRKHMPAAVALSDMKPYDWIKLTYLIRWQQSSNIVVLCFNNPTSLQKSIRRSLFHVSGEGLLNSPFIVHSQILQQISFMYDEALWQWRDLVRDYENNRPSVDRLRTDYVGMHDLARHVIHSSETLAVASKVIDSVLEEAQRYYAVHSAGPDQQDDTQGLRYCKSVIECLHLRSKALQERLSNEMNLAFHISSQHDSKQAERLARAAQLDSNTMKTISVLGLLFLPGTFVSAIFSMSFFSSSGGDGRSLQWAVSEKFWIYWVVVIPVTAATIVWWLRWQKSLLVQTIGDGKAKQEGDRSVKAENSEV